MTVETLEALRGSFNRRLRAEGKADRTLVLYGQSITYFSQWLAEEGLPADLENLTRDNVLSWLEALRTRKLSDGTIRTRWRGMRRFVTWLVTEEIITSDPLAGITVDKPEAPSVPVFSDEQLAALLDACKGKTFIVFETARIEGFLGRRVRTPRASWPDELPLRPANFVSGLEKMPVVFTPTQPLPDGRTEAVVPPKMQCDQLPRNHPEMSDR